MDPSHEQALLIFTRNPELGKCKTRLAATVGDQTALDIYLHLLRHTALACRALKNTDKFVYYSQYLGTGGIWPTSEFIPMLQAGPDLGARMKNAFAEAFARGYQRVVIVGSDLPDLSTQDLQRAFHALEEHDAVLGPAADGGYYLLGLTRMIPGLFENKPWGTSCILELTRSDLQGFQVFLLEEKNDVDRYEDIRDRPEFTPYLKELPDDPKTTG